MNRIRYRVEAHTHGYRDPSGHLTVDILAWPEGRPLQRDIPLGAIPGLRPLPVQWFDEDELLAEIRRHVRRLTLWGVA